MTSREEIACPACGERILAIAQKCKHCGEWRTTHAPPPPPGTPQGEPLTPMQQADPAPLPPTPAPQAGMSLPKALAIGCAIFAAFIIGIGVLAAIAIPKFSDTKDRAIQAALKSDLRILASAQETYFARYGQYASDVNSLSPDYFTPAPDITITIRPIDSTGWEAIATHSGAPGMLCQMRLEGLDFQGPSCTNAE